MTEQEFLDEVKQELDNIKIHATKEEIEQLDFEHFDPRGREECIYGQMANDCRSERATELINKCAIRVVDFKGFNGPEDYEPFPVQNFDSFKEWINGLVKDGYGVIDHDHNMYRLSCLEVYIMSDRARESEDEKCREIIQYLKGEIDTITL